VPLTPLASSYDHLLLDLDGCLWVGDEPTERATDALTALRVAGKGIAFVTNDGRHSAEEQVRKLWRLGFQASAEEVVTVGGALQFHLAERYGHDRAAAVVVGSPSLHRHVEQAGLRIVNDTAFASRAGVVVVGAHDGFDYAFDIAGEIPPYGGQAAQVVCHRVGLGTEIIKHNFELIAIEQPQQRFDEICDGMLTKIGGEKSDAEFAVRIAGVGKIRRADGTFHERTVGLVRGEQRFAS